jgi:hypothetical protein
LADTGTQGGANGVTVSLPVLAATCGTGGIRPSKLSKWRAGVLVTVHVIIGIHVLYWLKYGMTLSPIEPSESMYTLELGRVNMGFIFFVLALLSTVVFGRVFCG